MTYLLVLFVGMFIGAIVERWRWLNSECAKLWTKKTGETERLI